MLVFEGNGAKNDFRGFVSHCVHHRFPRRMHVHTTKKIKPCLRDKKRNKLSLLLAEKVQVWELHFFRKLPVTSRFDSSKKENEGKLTKILFLMTCFEPNLNGVIYPSTVCVCVRETESKISSSMGCVNWCICGELFSNNVWINLLEDFLVYYFCLFDHLIE